VISTLQPCEKLQVLRALLAMLHDLADQKRAACIRSNKI
jgi:hypothetical protein